MGIFKTSNYIDVYRIKSQSKNIETMSGRDKASTTFINSYIISQLDLSKASSVLDIGCGDGTFLASIKESILNGVGIVPTEDELIRLNDSYSMNNIVFAQGLSSSLGISDNSISRVVCNSVLFILPSYLELEKTISEISRVTQSNGLVYLGEVMIKDELKNARREYGDSLVRWLVFMLRKRGVKAFFSSCAILLRCLITDEPFIIAPKNYLIVSSEVLLELCAKYNLTLIKKTTHSLINEKAEVYEVPSRLNFLLKKLK